MVLQVHIVDTSASRRRALAARVASIPGCTVVAAIQDLVPGTDAHAGDAAVVLVAYGADAGTASGSIDLVRAQVPGAWIVAVGDKFPSASDEALHRSSGADASVGDIAVRALLEGLAASPARRECDRPAPSARLAGSGLHETSPHIDIDGMAGLATALFDAKVALVNIVGDRCRWCGSMVRSEVDPYADACPFCPYTIEQAAPLLVPDAEADARFSGSAFVTGSPFIRFYVGVPLTIPDGNVRGVLCVLDTVRRHKPPAQALATLQNLANHLVDLGELRRQHRLLAAQSQVVAGIEQAVGVTEADLETLANRAGVLSFDVTADSLAVTRVSDGIEPLLGYRPSWWIDQPHVWRDLVAENDRPAVIAAARRCETTRDDQWLSFEMVDVRGRPVRLQGRVQTLASPPDAKRLRFFLGRVSGPADDRLAPFATRGAKPT